jgi:hypothetical protein
MPKKESVIQPSSEEDYDSESDGPKVPIREVNRANVLNYESDSSEDADKDDSDEMYNIPKFKKPTKELAEVSTSNPWGANKKSFYASGKGEANSDDNMSSSEAEEDQ